MELKVGIFAPHAIGDMAQSTSILKYAKELWPNHKVVWFIHPPFIDMLKENPYVSEIRPYKDIYLDKLRINKTEKLNDAEKMNMDGVKDITIGFFPVPWQNQDMISQGIQYSSIPAKIFNCSKEWHPCLFFSKEEELKAEAFVGSTKNPKIMLETFYKSGQTPWNQETTKKTLDICRSILPNCEFIFASPKSHIGFESFNPKECGEFTPRQCIPIYNKCDLFIGVSSGISNVTTAWSAKKEIVRIEFCGSKGLSTCNTARSRHVLCTTEPMFIENLQIELHKLKEVFS